MKRLRGTSIPKFENFAPTIFTLKLLVVRPGFMLQPCCGRFKQSARIWIQLGPVLSDWRVGHCVFTRPLLLHETAHDFGHVHRVKSPKHAPGTAWLLRHVGRICRCESKMPYAVSKRHVAIRGFHPLAAAESFRWDGIKETSAQDHSRVARRIMPHPWLGEYPVCFVVAHVRVCAVLIVHFHWARAAPEDGAARAQ